MTKMGYLTQKDKERLQELVMGGVPTSAAEVMIEEMVDEKVGEALRAYGVIGGDHE